MTGFFSITSTKDITSFFHNLVNYIFLGRISVNSSQKFWPTHLTRTSNRTPYSWSSSYIFQHEMRTLDTTLILLTPRLQGPFATEHPANLYHFAHVYTWIKDIGFSSLNLQMHLIQQKHHGHRRLKHGLDLWVTVSALSYNSSCATEHTYFNFVHQNRQDNSEKIPLTQLSLYWARIFLIFV
jgi:hypothetical protein